MTASKGPGTHVRARVMSEVMADAFARGAAAAYQEDVGSLIEAAIAGFELTGNNELDAERAMRRVTNVLKTARLDRMAERIGEARMQAKLLAVTAELPVDLTELDEDFIP